MTAPASATGAYTLSGNTTYTARGASGRANRTATHTYRVSVTPPPPPGTDPCYDAVSPITEAGTCYLLTLAESPPELTAGETTTLTGTLYNPRDYGLTNGSVTLRPPTANWTVAPVEGRTFETLGSGAVRLARWNVTPPASAGGTVGVPGRTTYTRLGGPDFPNVSVAAEYPVSIVAANASASPC